MIPVTYRASFSYLLRNPWQLILSLIGIVIGVAVIVAVDLANSSARKAFLLSMDGITGQATHQVIGGPLGVPESVYTDLRVGYGIRSIAPVVDGSINIGKIRAHLLGIDLFAEQEIRSYTDGQNSRASGNSSLFVEFLVRPGVISMSEQTAADLGIAIGDTLKVLAGGRSYDAELVTVFPDDGNGGLERIIVTDIATAQEWLGRAGWLSRIDVRIEDSDPASMVRLTDALPAGTQLLSSAGRTRSTADMSQAFMTNLTAMSLLALLVGLFLIFNSVNFSVLQRRGLIGVLRALGLTRRQLLTMILVEAGLIGLAAAVLGVLFGVALGDRLLDLVSRTINDLYFRVTVTDISISSISVIKGIAAGVGAALIAAAMPALEATSYEPRLALTRSALEYRARSALPWVTTIGIAGMIAAVLLILLSGTNLVAGITAVFLLILGFALCVPLFVHIASGLAAPLAQSIGGASGRMAVGGISSTLSRTGVAIVALAVALSATIGISIMVDSFRGSVGEWLEQSLRADIYVGANHGTMDPGLVDVLRNLDGVAESSTAQEVQLEDVNGLTRLRVIEMAPGGYAGAEILDAKPESVWPLWDNDDAVLASEPYAYQNDVGAGDVISLPTDTGPVDFTLAATFQSYDIHASILLISRATYARHFRDDTVGSIGLYLADGVSGETITDRMFDAASGIQSVRVVSNETIREQSLRIFDRTFVITDVLYWLTLGVAFIGILSSMLALQLERAREFATLRALGMTPNQVAGMITTQTGFIGLLSSLAAVPLGIAMSYVLIKVINRRAFGWQIDMSVTPDILVVSVVYAMGAAMLAGLYPAWRAGQSQPAIAMREE